MFLCGGSEVKASACNAGDPCSIPGSGRSPEKEMATHSSILAWRISWTEEPGRLQSTGSQRVGHDWATSLSLSCSNTGFPGGSVVKNLPANAEDSSLIPGSGRSPGGGNGNPFQYTCWKKIPWQRSLVGYSPWGSQRVGHDWAHTRMHAIIDSEII